MRPSSLLLKRILCVASTFVLGIYLYGCSATPVVEGHPKNPNIEIQPRTPFPDLPLIATQPTESVAPTPESKVVAQRINRHRERSIYFLPHMASVDDEGKEKLRGCADLLKRNSKKLVVLVGYSDDMGSKSYNIAIAEQRITAVSSVLRSLGVQPRQIRRNRSNSVKSATHPCRSEECHQQMRRVEFVCGA